MKFMQDRCHFQEPGQDNGGAELCTSQPLFLPIPSPPLLSSLEKHLNIYSKSQLMAESKMDGEDIATTQIRLLGFSREQEDKHKWNHSLAFPTLVMWTYVSY